MLNRFGTRHRFGPFDFFHGVLTPRHDFERQHQHRRPHLIMVFSGAWTERVCEKKTLIEPGEVLFHPAQFEHATHPAADHTEVVILRIDTEVVHAFCPLYGNVARDVRLPFETVRGVPDRIREELLHFDEAASVILESLAMQLLALGSRVSTNVRNVPPWFSRVLAIVHRGFAGPLTLRRIAREIAISPSRLGHVFGEITGRPITVYIRECRIRAAAKALRETSLSIGDVAVACGFYDQTHLTRVFKQLRGVTPFEYRCAHQARGRAQPKPLN